MAEAVPVRLRMVVPPAPWTGAIADGSVRIPGVGWDRSAEPERLFVPSTRNW